MLNYYMIIRIETHKIQKKKEDEKRKARGPIAEAHIRQQRNPSL